MPFSRAPQRPNANAVCLILVDLSNITPGGNVAGALTYVRQASPAPVAASRAGVRRRR